MATKEPKHPRRLSVDDIKKQAIHEAGEIDDDLALDVQKAAKIRRKYGARPLIIKVPWVAAIISGNWDLIFQLQMSWSPYPRNPTPKQVKDSGIYVVYQNREMRIPNGKHTKDKDQFTIKQILEAGKPEPDYIWIIDWIRSWQKLYNWFRVSFGMKRIKLMDCWGSLFYMAESGEDYCYLPLVTRPERLADLIQELSAAIEDGDDAFERLVERRDEEQRHKSGGI